MRAWAVTVAGLLLVAAAGASAWAADAPAPEPESSLVLARVNGVAITYGDLKLRVEMLGQASDSLPLERRRELLRALVREEILAQEADKVKLSEEPAIKERLEELRRQVVIEELLKRNVASRVQIGDADLHRAYDENTEMFTIEEVGASHIMVKTQAEAEAIRLELLAGKDFAELARATSQDTGSAAKGGDLGMLGRGQTAPEFEEAAFALKEGEISQVVKTEFGYHIIKGGKHTRVTRPFEEVKDQLRQMLMQRKQREALLAYMGELEKAAKTEIYEDRLQ